MRNFKEAMYQAHLLYGVEFTDESEFEELALIGYHDIGNQNVRYYHIVLPVNKEDNSVELPCNVENIEAVTIPMEDYKHVDGINSNGDVASMFTESYTEAMKIFHDPTYAKGKLVHYTRIGEKLFFEYPYPEVDILYEGQELDDDGLPYLTDNEVDALAVYVSYVTKYKEGITTMNANMLEIANQLRQMWLIKCDHARIPQQIDQNMMDKILDAKTNWNRKLYGKSFKPTSK